jgi:hypothetical protein
MPQRGDASAPKDQRAERQAAAQANAQKQTRKTLFARIFHA